MFYFSRSTYRTTMHTKGSEVFHLKSVRSLPNKQSSEIIKSSLNKHPLECASHSTSNQNSSQTYQNTNDESLKISSHVPTCPNPGNHEDQTIIVPDIKVDGEIKETILESTNLLISSKINEPSNGHENNVSDTKLPEKASEHEYNNSENVPLKVNTCDLTSKNDSNSHKTVVIWL